MANVVSKVHIQLGVSSATMRGDIDKATRTLRGINAQAATATRGLGALRGMFMQVAAAAAIAAAGFSFGGIGRSAEQFNQSMANSTAIMGNLSATMRGDLITAAKDVALQTRFSAKEAADAYYFLASAGLDAAQSIGALPQVAKFAQAGNFDLALATDLATDAQSALGLTSKDAATNLANLTRVTDVLIKANTLANASAQQFSTAMTGGAAVAARSLGIDIEATTAVLAAYADQGIKAEEAGTAYGIVLRDLTTKAIENAEAFKRAKVAVFDDAGELRNVADIVADLEKLLGGLSDQAQKAKLLELGFSDKSLRFVQTLLGTSDKIRGYEAELRKAAGTTADVASKQIPEFTRAMNRLKAIVTNSGITVFAGALTGLGSTINFAIDALAGLEGGFAEGTLKALAFAAAFGAALYVIPKLIAALRGIYAALRLVQAGQIAVQLLSGPKGWATVAAAVLAASGAVYALDKAFEQVSDSAERAQLASEQTAANLAQGMQAAVPAVDEITDSIDNASNAVDEFATRAASIAESVRTPLEALRATNNELWQMVNAGALSFEDATRASAAEVERLLNSIDIPAVLRDGRVAVGIEVDQSPLERLQRQAATLAEAVATNQIPTDVYARAIEAAERQFANSMREAAAEIEAITVQPTGAALRGTAEGFAAVQNGRNEIANMIAQNKVRDQLLADIAAGIEEVRTNTRSRINVQQNRI